MNIKNIDIPIEKIKDFCIRWQINELSLFGSVLRTDFRPDSDVDIIVRFDVSANPAFSSLEAMESELENIFTRKVDLITYQGIENSLNYLRRKEILSSAKVIYAKRRSIPA